jgi:tripartite-type tricarboxylate transporter receptor subunit TctC
MKKGKELLVITGLVGLGVFLVFLNDLAVAKDPDYPTKPINFYIGYTAGGATDLSARAFSEAAGKYLGQQFVPINKTGGGGSLAAMAAMTAKPDGYTLCGGFATSTACVVPLSKDAPYKDLSGFTLIANYGTFAYPLIVKADAPWKTWKEFIEWAKKNPKAAKVGLSGALSVDVKGLYLWRIAKQEQADLTFVAFKGTPEVVTAILGGHITLYSVVADASTVPFLKEGRTRLLMYMGKEKIPGYENVPSAQELYGISTPAFMGVVGPKGLPAYVLKKLDDAFAKAVQDPQFISTMERTCTPALYMNRGDFSQYADKTFLEVREVVKNFREEEAKKKQ